jgi:hypothetical protein
MSTIVQYFIPDDNEDSEKCNAFVIYKEVENIRLLDIKENFPLPGEYYYRFKFKFQNKNVWIDFNNEDATLPKFEGKIIMKVSRISWEENIPKNKYNEKQQEFPDLF